MSVEASVPLPGGWTPLHRASRKGNVDEVRRLIEERADVNAQTLQGSTPLHLAMARYRFEAMRLLLDAKADITLKNRKEIAPISVAYNKSYEATPQFLQVRALIFNAMMHQLKAMREYRAMAQRELERHRKRPPPLVIKPLPATSPAPSE